MEAAPTGLTCGLSSNLGRFGLQIQFGAARGGQGRSGKSTGRGGGSARGHTPGFAAAASFPGPTQRLTTRDGHTLQSPL